MLPLVVLTCVRMNPMANTLMTLLVQIGVDSKEAITGIKETESRVKKFQTSAADAGRTAGVAFAAVVAAVVVLNKAYNMTIGVSQQYADSIRGLSNISGASAQSTSILVQVLDDYNISAEEAAIATKALTKEGYAPTIETLATLSDKYLSLSTVQQKNEFVLKNLGKGGLKWVEVLNKGSDAIRKQSTEVNKALVLNGKQLEASKALFLEMDALKDSSMGLGVAIGNYLTPAMQVLVHTTTGSSTSLSEWFGQLAEARIISIETSRILEEQGRGGLARTREQVEAAKAQAIINVANYKAIEDGTGAIDDNADALDGQKAAVKAAEDALKAYKDMLDAVSQANQDAESFIQSYADFQKGYDKDHADALKDVADAEEKLRDAMSKKAKTPEQKDAKREAIDEAKTGLLEAGKAVQDLEATWHESTQKMIYDMILAKVSVDGLTNAEFKATQDLAVQMGIRTQAQADEAKGMMDKAQAAADGIALQEDVMAEKKATDAQLLELENQRAFAAGETTSTVVGGAQSQAAAIQQVIARTDSATLSMIRYGDAARAALSTAGGVGSYKPPKSYGGIGGIAPVTGMPRDNGGSGVAGTPYNIGVPEVFVPKTSGEFIPLGGAKGKGLGATYNIVINNPKKEAAEDSIRSALKKLSYMGAAA